MPFVIAICHQKGGVAKTTSTLSLGACFTDQRREVLLIDLDPQANLTSGVGFKPSEMRRSAADVLLGNDTLLTVSRETSLPGLDVVPSNADMLLVARALHLREPYEYILRDNLARPDVAHYQVVLIDCPPSLGPLTISALTAAQLVIVPTQCEYFSIQALESSLKLVQVVRAKTNPKLMFRLLATMYDMRGALHTRALEQMRQRFPRALLQSVIGVDAKLRESQLAGRPITVHAPHSRGALQYRQLAEELTPYVEGQVLQSA